MPTTNTSSVDELMKRSYAAFTLYRNSSFQQRRNLLHTIADVMDKRRENLIAMAATETHLSKERLQTEFDRTLFQLRSYGDACATGFWLDVRINTAMLSSQPPKPDLRKTMVPLGPVVVFGASNFPFAYSTAGGDTACALAAGCSVVVRGHFAHAETSAAVAMAIKEAVAQCGFANETFLHVGEEGSKIGEALVCNSYTKAVGFTGSLAGGRALFDLAQRRPEPIPVFAEMGSTNPVFLLPKKLKQATEAIAASLANSVTESVGQFCTNPGIIVSVKTDALEKFKTSLARLIGATQPAKMLHEGIARHFSENRLKALAIDGVSLLTTNHEARQGESIPTLAFVSAQTFLQQPQLAEEVFGPYTILVECETSAEMLRVAQALTGQLTTTIWATEEELRDNNELFEALEEHCGRIIFNGVPTGVTVATAMHHSGPYPACTDSRFTAVGADGIKRFARPVCYQNWPDNNLPIELQNANPLGIWRMINDEMTKEPIR